jgi:hypothetical protein
MICDGLAGGTLTLDKRMKKLIQQLGEAIHESVSESEQIAGVVQDIRRHGFDVLLMLEATIGLNELEQQPHALQGASQGPSLLANTAGKDELSAPADSSGFTPQDLKFLRSLRISMQGEETSDSGSSHRA